MARWLVEPPITRAVLYTAGALATIAVLRFWLAGALPLTDTTEARFAEIARKMVETGDWLVPQHDYGVPYLAKPPLAFWLAASGIAALGAGELGPRMPILLVTSAFVWLFFRFARDELGEATAAAAALMLASSLLFFVAGAAVMTDLVLTACASLSLFAAWQRARGAPPAVELAAFAALGCGLLTKGPIAAVMIGVPLAISAFSSRRVREGLARINWLAGAAVAALIALPWYAAAEWRSPGFLRYFIVGEHIARFLEPGWTGDLYGRAHDAPRGTVWLFLAIGALPFSPVGAWWLASGRAAVRARVRQRSDLVIFLAAAALAPLTLFTFSRNVVFPYALPALPAAFLLLAVLAGDEETWQRRLPCIAAIAVTAVASYCVLVAANGAFVARQTQRSVIASIEAPRSSHVLPIYYWCQRFFSADYYSRGRAETVCDAVPVAAALSSGTDFRVVAEDALPEALASKLVVLGEEAGMTVYAPPAGSWTEGGTESKGK